MKKIIIVFLFLVSHSSMAWGGEKQNISEYDGNDWNGWKALHKSEFIAGFIAGAGYVAGNNMENMKYANNKENAWLGNFYSTEEEADKTFKKYIDSSKKKEVKFTIDEVKAIYTKVWANCTNFHNSSLSGYAIIKITNTQIVDGLDELYKDFKNRNIYINDAIFVIKKQISGTTPEDIEKILIFLRSEKKNSDVLYIEDDKGKFLRYISFP